MRYLYHTHLSPFCRKIRMMLKEKGLEFELVCEKSVDKNLEFFALNPAGEVPVLIEEDGAIISGTYAIGEYLEEHYPQINLVGTTPAHRAEVRRLVDWFDHKFDYEVTQNVLFEKAFKQYFGGGEPNSTAIRNGKTNLLYHLDYIGYLAGERYFLAGDTLTLADLAAASHLSALDYIGDVPWEYNKMAHNWYALMKSRPSMRCILIERVRGVRPRLIMKIRISEQAKSLGFDAVAFTTPDLPVSAVEGLNEFLTAGHHGDMLWMEEKADRRADPKTLWPEAKSVIMLGHNYGPDFNPMEKLAHKTTGNISCYALNHDYHDVIKKKLKTLARWVVQEFGCEVKVFVDTAPVMEKTLAAQAGLGWQGKHTCLVSRGVW